MQTCMSSFLHVTKKRTEIKSWLLAVQQKALSSFAWQTVSPIITDVKVKTATVNLTNLLK